MDVEQADNKQEPQPATQPETLLQLYRNISESFRISVEKKDSSEIAHLTKLTKRIAGRVGGANLIDLLKELQTPYAGLLLDGLSRDTADVPSPKTEEDIFQLILVAAYHFKARRFGHVVSILRGLLFEKPQELCQRPYLEPLSNWLLYKYLNALELSGQFEQQKQQLYITLKAMQAIKSEALFSTVYIFLLRNLLMGGSLREVGQLLKNCDFPEHSNFTQLCKFLFYKGVFLARTGEISQALVLISESLRKAPDEEAPAASKSKAKDAKPKAAPAPGDKAPKEKEAPQAKVIRRGVRGFRLLVRKQQVVLQLMLNETPSQRTLALDPQLGNYRQLTSFVGRGDFRSFEDLLARESAAFERDLVLPLLKKMKTVVLRNALKKLSTAYTKISIDDALTRIGVAGDTSFDLLAFLAKSQQHIEKFHCDPQNRVVDFAKSLEAYSDDKVRETLFKRIKHIQSLEEQVIRSLKYKDKGLEANMDEKAREEEDDDDLENLNISLDDLDI